MGLFDSHLDPDAVETCVDCGAEPPVSALHFMEDYGWLCDECIDIESQAVCSQCGKVYDQDDCTNTEDGWVCMDCDSDLYWEHHEE